MPKHLPLLVGLIVLAAVGVLIRPVASADYPTEPETEAMIPTQVGTFRSRPGPAGPGHSYRMEQSTYDTLQPLAIVARIYEDGPKVFDAVVITAARTSSIHDPRDCFSRQGWDIVDVGTIDVPTSQGPAPFRLMEMRGTEGQGNRLALFSYRGPDGFHTQVRDLNKSQLRHALRTLDREHVVAYRFIDMTQRATKEELAAFAGRFLDAVRGQGGGFLR